MRIVSQNKQLSVNFDRVHLIVEENCVIARDTWSSRGFSLGEYRTSGRAKEVFEHINGRTENGMPFYMPEE